MPGGPRADTPNVESPPAHPLGPTRRLTSGFDERRLAVAAAVGFVWLRVAFILSVSAFETPDTESYRSGQATRPPLSSALLSVLGDTPYVALSALVSSAGFVALVWSLWNPQRRRWSIAMAVIVLTVSLLPMVSVYEHWLVPDSLLVGLTLIALALAARRIETRWYPWLVIALCVTITLTKEVGIGIVLLVALVMMIRRHARIAGVALLTSAMLFALVVLPSSNREGRVLWGQPLDTELTMERFRVIVNAVLWPDLSPELAEVRDRAAACGMNSSQLIAETFRITDQAVDFADCPDLWPAADEVSQLDLLEAHLRNPAYVTSSLERGFVPDMHAMSFWGGYHVDSTTLMTFDRFPAGGVAVVPLSAIVVALLCRRGRRLAAVALVGSAMALAAALLDPSSQDRHTLVFRVAAFAIGLIALTEATGRNREDDRDETSTMTSGDTDVSDAVTSEGLSPVAVVSV